MLAGEAGFGVNSILLLSLSANFLVSIFQKFPVLPGQAGMAGQFALGFPAELHGLGIIAHIVLGTSKGMPVQGVAGFDAQGTFKKDFGLTRLSRIQGHSRLCIKFSGRTGLFI